MELVNHQENHSDSYHHPYICSRYPVRAKLSMKSMLPMKDVLYLVLHCSSTRVSQKVTVDDLDRWHRAKGWAGCGYHIGGIDKHGNYAELN